MDNTIYSAEFAKKLCDEYHSLTDRINRSIKEAVRYGRYETNLVQTENCFLDDSVVVSISWR